MRVKKTIGLIAVFLLTACSNDPGFVARKWSANIRELGVAPIFPPREDVYVGDIYLPPLSPDKARKILESDDYVPIGVWLGHVPGINHEISAFYQSRSEFPKSSSAIANALSGTAGPPILVEQPTGTTDVFVSGNAMRLRMVGFPEFLSASYTGVNVAALIPAEALTLGLGFSFSDVERATIKIPMAESYGIPAMILLNKVLNGNTFVYNPKKPRCTEAQFLLPAGQRDADGMLPEYFYADIISEVFYARAIDIEISFSAGFASDLRASLPLAPGGQITPPTGVAAPTPGSSPVGPSGTLGQSASGSLAALTSPGVAVNVVSSSAGGISLRRIYERPIAIGYRGFSLRVKSADCTVDPLAAIGDFSGNLVPKSVRKLVVE